MKQTKKHLTPKSKDLSRWYNEIVQKAELADYAPVKGCMVIRPYGYAIWENIQNALDEMIKEAGVKNAYFPLFIPESFLKKEKEHVKGFSPELAVVTIGGGKKLKEKLIVRPTSETIMYHMYSRWIKSWRDLPLLINQWCNVVRWERRTYLFLRTMEFLWQEGHTCHQTHKGAKQEVARALKVYKTLFENYLAISGFSGRKSENEKFPGALETFSFESLMPDGKALQSCTSHDLGQNFSKSFDISFQNKNGKQKYVWQTCWGLSTRSIGGLIMAHGDDNGLVLPPKIAPIQVVIVPIFSSAKINKSIEQLVLNLKGRLEKKFRTEIDLRTEQTAGFKFNEWELKGVPLRLEVGPEDLKQNQVITVRRDTGKKQAVQLSRLSKFISQTLNEIQENLLKRHKNFSKRNTTEVSNYEEFKNIMKHTKGFIKTFWCENAECEEKIKSETKATTRCLSLDLKKENGKCIYCGKKAVHKWLFAQAY